MKQKPTFARTGYLASAVSVLPLSYNNQTITSPHDPPFHYPLYFAS